ncbi:MAG: hypothetical protein VCF08_15890 [Alphaproteobacteria bacterium]|jgi:UDP-sulfoquinovose synthase
MNILILGGDGYLGWPTAMHFAAKGDTVWVADNFAKRKWELEDGIEPLLTDDVVDTMLDTVRSRAGRIDPNIIAPQIRWAGGEIVEDES